MDRVIEQLEFRKQDLKGLIVKLTLENDIKTKIIDECKDELKVQLLEEDVEENNFAIADALEVLDEMEVATNILSFSNGSCNPDDIPKTEKRP